MEPIDASPEAGAPDATELDAFLREDLNHPRAAERLGLVSAGKAEDGAAPAEAADAELARRRVFQRVRRVAPDDETAWRLIGAGLDSAHRIARDPEHRFVRERAGLFAGEAEARATHRRAVEVKTRIQHVVANLHSAVGSPHFRAMLVNPVDAELEAYATGLPSYADLFGGLDYCACPHDSSIFSPAAYFLDLMRITDDYVTDPNTHKAADNIPAGYTLRERRPDLFEIPLDAANTNTLVPLLRIVNQVLERRLLSEQRVTGGTAAAGGPANITLASSASPDNDAYVGMTVLLEGGTGVGQSATITVYDGSTRRAEVASRWSVEPDNTTVYVVAQAPFQTVAAAPYPFNLPYNLPLAQVRDALAAQGSSLAEVFAAVAAPLTGGAAAGGTDTTVVLAQSASDADGAYVGMRIDLVGGTGAGQARTVSAYAGATRTATVSAPFHPAPDATTQYHVFDTLGEAREVVGLSLEQYAVVSTPRTTPEALAPYYGKPTLDVDELSRVDVFLERTGLARAQLNLLLTQELSDAEVAAGVAETFFINATGEGAAMVIVTDEANPSAPFQKIANVTVARLDRLNRFIRLAAATGWDYPSLDWAMKSVGAAEIGRAVVETLAGIRRLQRGTSLTPVEVAALWHDMKTIGKGNGPAPIDLFDRVFNPPALLGGQDPYTSVAAIPFDPSAPLSWVIDDSAGMNATLRGRLRGALGVSDDDLTLLGRYVRALGGGSAVEPLVMSLTNLSWLYRLSKAASVLRLTVQDYLGLVGLMYYPEAPGLVPPAGALHPTVEGALAQRARVEWFRATAFTVGSARYVLTGDGGPGYTPPYRTADLAPFIQNLATSSAGARLTRDAFAQADVDAEGSAEIFARLVSVGLLTELGLVLPDPARWDRAAASYPLSATSFEVMGITAAESAAAFTQLQESEPPILLPASASTATLAEGFTRDTDLSFLLPQAPDADNKRNAVRDVLMAVRDRAGAAELAFLFPVAPAGLVGGPVTPHGADEAYAALVANGVLVADAAAGQSRTVTAYDGATRTATLSAAWTTAPGEATLYEVTRSLDAGTVAAAAVESVTLGASASAEDGAYEGCEVAIVSGTGAGQRRIVTLYDGPSRTAYLATAWTTVPDTTSGYAVARVLTAGIARAHGGDTLQLSVASSSIGGAYVGDVVTLLPSATLSPAFGAGTSLDFLFASKGAGEEGTISAYDGPTRTATLSAAFSTAPDGTSVYVVSRSVDTGTAQAGDASTITLATTASQTDGAYDSLEVRITGGTGSGQRRAIASYAGATRVATVASAWDTAPDATSVYAVVEAATTGTARWGDATHLGLAADAAAESGAYDGLPLALVANPDAGPQRDAVRETLLALRASAAATAGRIADARALQEANAEQGLANFLRTTPDRLAAILPFAGRASDLDDFVDELLTPLPGGQVPASIPPFVEAVARTLVLFDTLGYDEAQVHAAVAMPTAFNVAQPYRLTFDNLRSLSTLKALEVGLNDTTGALLAYLALPPDAGCPAGVPGARVRALAALSGWPAGQVCALIGRFWPAGEGESAYGYATVDGVARLAAAFDVGARVGMDAGTMVEMSALATLPLAPGGVVSPAAWTTYTRLASIALAGARAAAANGGADASTAAVGSTTGNTGLAAAAGSAVPSTATTMSDLSRTLDEQERDALAGYTLWVLRGKGFPLEGWSDLYQYLLIDVGMSGCDSISPIAQGIASVQLYLQRARLMLEPGVTDLPIPEVWWEWMSGYRLWEANRKVFLYPENYLDPARRPDATPPYDELVGNLLQTDITDTTVSAAYDSYFAAFSEVANLVQCASYQCKYPVNGPGSEVDTLFVFGRTNTQPYVWYWRRFDGLFAWTPWRKVDQTIASPFVAPVYAFNRLFIFWTEVDEVDSSRVAGSDSITIGTTSGRLRYSFLDGDAWSAPQTMEEPVVVTYKENFALDSYVQAIQPQLPGADGAYDPANVYWQKLYPLHVPAESITVPSAYPNGEQILVQYGYATLFTRGTPGNLPDPPSPQSPRAQFQIREGAYTQLQRFNAQRNGAPAAPASGYLQQQRVISLEPNLASTRINAALVNYIPLFNPQLYLPKLDRQGGKLMVAESSTNNAILDNFYADDHPPYTMAAVAGMTPVDPPFALLGSVSGKGASIVTVKNRVGSFLFGNGDETFLVATTQTGLRSISEVLTAASSYPPYPAGEFYLYVGDYTDQPPVFANLTFAFLRLSTHVAEPLGRKLRIAGIPALLTLESQKTPELPFSRLQPVSGKAIPPRSDQLDFEGAYGEYFWEIFFHAPFLVADTLSLNKRYAEAKAWYEYVFNPTQQPSAGDEGEERFWRFLPFRTMTLETLTQTLANPAQIAAYNYRPFDPDAIARLRISAYAKAVVMHYIDNLLDWADDLFALDTRESITQATQLYVLAADLLGPAPQPLGACPVPAPMTYNEIRAEYDDRTIATGTAQGAAARTLVLAAGASAVPDAYTGMYVSITAGTGSGQQRYVTAYDGATRTATVELPWDTLPVSGSTYRVFLDGIPQFLVRAENTGQLATAPAAGPALAGVPFNDVQAYFCVPENQELAAYWARVEDRLFKIRHCMNLQGQVRTLAQFAPPIDPRQLIRAAQAGISPLSVAGSADVPIPAYRFAVMLEKARSLASLATQLGGSLLSALEKKDAAALALLRQTQERTLLDLTTLVKEQQIVELEQTRRGLEESGKSAEKRKTYYADLLAAGLSPAEIANIVGMTVATVFNTLAGVTRTAAAIGYAVPQVGSPFAMTYGGQQIGSALTAASGAFEIGGALATFAAQLSLTIAGYQRRAEEWGLQEALAGYDAEAVKYQLAATDARIQIARRDLEVHAAQLRQNRETEAFLTRSFTSEQLYQWMAARLSETYFQAYSLAFALARSAERAFQFELGDARSFVAFGYWDSLRKGLLAGEALTLALGQMEKAYLDGTPRLLEIERTVSLLSLNPRAFLDLQRTGECVFELPEKLFDLDFPGHYARTLKTVSVSIPAVLGPYQNVHATLTQLSSQLLLRPDADGVRFLLGVPGAPLPGPETLRTNGWVNQQVALSRGVDDSGVFTLDFNDPRYLPFEGTGAVSSWRLSLPPASNRFDFAGIGDVVVKIRYTARDGGARFRQEVTALEPIRRYDGTRFWALAQAFSTQWYDFLHLHPDPDTQTLSFDVAGVVAPHLSNARLAGFFVQLDVPPGVRAAGRAPYLRLRLGTGVDVSFNLDPYNRALHVFQATPPMETAEGPASLAFTLADTPSALKEDGYLDPAVVRNVALVLFYTADVRW